MIEYQSTRHKNPKITSTEAVLQGLAPDGGLYVPVDLPLLNLPLSLLESWSYEEIMSAVLVHFLPGFSQKQVENMVRLGYEKKFETADIVPLVSVGDAFVLELFHGPTSAFKDMALSLLPHFMTEARKLQGEEKETIILTATSGDTGKAALEGFRGVENTKIFVFYPEEGVSDLQKAQMQTQEGENIVVCAIQGNFDDAQRGVKEVFAQIEKQEISIPRTSFSSANSINIGRLAPQVAYYFKAYGDLLKRGVIAPSDLVDFVVPTGNFGNILAGYLAKELGLPLGKLVCASNDNNVLTEFLQTGRYNRNRPFYKTNSPSMDILVSSNLERLLWFLSQKDEEEIRQLMQELEETGEYQISEEMLAEIQNSFVAGYATQQEVNATIDTVWEQEGYLLDPHTAVAWKVYEEYKNATNNPVVLLATASPYKFPQSMLEAFGQTVPNNSFDAMRQLEEYTKQPIPKGLSQLEEKPVLHQDVIAKEAIASYIQKKVVGK